MRITTHVGGVITSHKEAQKAQNETRKSFEYWKAQLHFFFCDFCLFVA
jgi:hypothetical protein